MFIEYLPPNELNNLVLFERLENHDNEKVKEYAAKIKDLSKLEKIRLNEEATANMVFSYTRGPKHN